MQNISPIDRQTPSAQFILEKDVHSNTAPLLRWWFRLSGPEDVPASADFSIREAVRRGRIASIIIIGIVCTVLFLIPLLLLGAPTLLKLSTTIVGSSIGLLCCLAALPFNRSRQLRVVGVLLILAVNIIIATVVLSERQGLDPLFLTMFDLLVVSELIAALLLSPASAIWIAFFNIIEVTVDINVQPRSMMWMQMIPSQQLTYSLLARPLILYFVVAFVAYLWATSSFNALKRADRAEEIIKLEEREKERVQQLEESIEQILAVHMRVANGDISARAPIYQSYLLWRISAALNNLLSRFQSALLAERNLRHVTQEITQLRLALRTWRRGQSLNWYTNKETILSPLVNDLRYVLTPEQMHQKEQPSINPTTPVPPSINPTTPVPPTHNTMPLRQRVQQEKFAEDHRRS